MGTKRKTKAERIITTVKLMHAIKHGLKYSRANGPLARLQANGLIVMHYHPERDVTKPWSWKDVPTHATLTSAGESWLRFYAKLYHVDLEPTS